MILTTAPAIATQFSCVVSGGWRDRNTDVGFQARARGSHRLSRPKSRSRTRRAARFVTGAPRYEVALALETAALAELRARRPDRVLETNVEF